MPRALKFFPVTLLASTAIAFALCSVAFTGWLQEPVSEGVEGPVAFAVQAKAELQEPVISTKADKQDVTIVAVTEAEFETIEPPPLIGAAEKQEAESLAASSAPEEEVRAPALTRAVAKQKPASVFRVEKKVAAKRKTKKRQEAKSNLSVPLVLVPPRQTDIPKPVSEEGGKVLQNYGPPASNDHFRRK